MNPITVANLHTFCRVCLRELTVESRNTFDKPLSAELVETVACITLEQHLMTQICKSCCIRVTALYAFREKAIVSTGICKMLIGEYVEDDALLRLKTYCRVCLQRRTGKNEDRFSFKKNAKLCSLMFECTGLNVENAQSVVGDTLTDDERFPDIICDKCYNGFSNFAEIRSLAKLSEDYVKNLLNEHRAFKQDKEETNKILEQLPEQSEIIYSVENPLKLETEVEEEFNIKVETLDVVLKENLENSTLETLDCETDSIKSSFLDNQKVEEDDDEMSNVFETKQSECSTTTDRDSDEFSEVKIEKNKVETKKISKQKHKQLECEYCGKKFRNRIHFEGHVKGAHEGVENPFSCTQCENSKFGDYNALQRHITRKHKVNEASRKAWDGNIFDPPKKNKGIHVCLQCNRQFTRKSHLEEHMNSVHLAEDERPFKCQFCHKSFGSNKTLLRHEKNHSSEKPFACEFCPKRYNIKADFNAHMQRHSSSDTSLLCPICKRLKANVEELKAHVEMHNKSRRHQCTTCGKIFTKLFHLKEHETSVHLKLRPFKCTICEKTFATQRSQKEHEQIHDPNAEKKAICEICEMGFISRKQKSYHKAKVHNTKEPKIDVFKRKKSRKLKQNEESSITTTTSYSLDWFS